jgi:RHS repeat-associated protein
MNNKAFKFALASVGMLCAAVASAATNWSAQDYDLYSGDFNGDQKSDILYIAKESGLPSGIATGDASGAPNTSWQTWAGNYLGVQWYGGLYAVVVGDFNADGKSDLLLQRTSPGDSYLLLADSNGKITSINQNIASGALGIAWTRDQHLIHAGDFNYDGRADVFFQALTAAGTHAIVLADGNGYFTSGPTQTWTNSSWSAFKWSAKDAVINVGDFNGDNKADLLVRTKPNIVMIDYDIAIPVPVYKPNTFGVVLSQGGATPMQQVGVQQWNRNANGVDWSPNFSNVVVGSFSGNYNPSTLRQISDVLLQAKNSSKSSYLLTASAAGAIFPGNGALISPNVSLSSDSARLIAGNFDGGVGVGIYVQSLTPGGTNYVANTVGTSISASVHDSSAVTGIVSATAVGKTSGSFAVSNSGSATYSVPIVVPPGVMGMQPDLALSYSSNGGNGLVGVGWGIGGLSEISRCSKTVAQDGVTDNIKLVDGANGDRYCLNGNRLRVVSGTYGTTGSVYQTEIESFSRIKAYGSGSTPEYFIVEGKDGRSYRYGYNSTSRIEVTGTSVPRAWALDQVSDRSGNTMSLSYVEDTANGSYRPNEFIYTSNSNAGLSPAYKVVFGWEARPSTDVMMGYFAGGLLQELNRLNSIETRYNDPSSGTWRLVRKYQMSYNNTSSTQRSRLKSIQECEGKNGTCLSPLTIAWKEGDKGWVTTEVVSGASSTALMQYAQTIDVDGDGRSDVIYPDYVGGAINWFYMKGNASGAFDAPVNTGVYAGDTTNIQYAFALPTNCFGDGRVALLTQVPGAAYTQALHWNGSSLVGVYTSSWFLDGHQWTADVDGDGLDDLVYAAISGSTAALNVQKCSRQNSSITFAPGIAWYSTSATSLPINTLGVAGRGSTFKISDFNGDGRADIVYNYFVTPSGYGLPYYNWQVLLSTGSAFVAGQSWQAFTNSPNYNTGIITDINGDGIADVFYFSWIFENNWTYQVLLGTGTGLTTGPSVTISTSPSDIQLVDYDGDGKADLLYKASGSAWFLRRWAGNGFDTALVAITVPAQSVANTLRIADFDGDRQLDIGYQSNNQFKAIKHRGNVGDLVASITDGFGNDVSVTYAPLTDSTVYTKGSNAVFPEIDIQNPIYVVKQYTMSDGVGSSYAVNEAYSGARIHLHGRGFEGFANRTETDSRTGISVTTTLRQDFPFTGMVKSTTVKQPNGKTISSTSIDYTDLVTSSAQYNDRHYPYAATTTQTSYEVSAIDTALDGAPIKQVVTSLTNLDEFGNAGTMTATTTDLTGSNQAFTATTVNTITNDTTNWCLGFVTLQTVTSSVPNAAPLKDNATPTRTVKFEPDADATKCRVYRQTLEPDTSVQVSTRFLFDSFGHVRQTTVSATGVTDRIASVNYGAEGVFAKEMTNAVGETAYKTYDYALGVLLTSTDPNGIQVSSNYDGFGRKTRDNAPDGTATTWTLYSCNMINGYCGDGLLRYQIVQQQLDGSASHAVVRTDTQFYDSFNRALYTQAQGFSGANTTVRSIYNNKGQLVQKSTPYLAGGSPVYSTTYFDLLGRVTKTEGRTSDADASLRTVTYSYSKLTQSVVDPLSHTASQVRNAIGQVVQVTDANSSVTQYQYDALGNLAKTTDSAGNQVSSAYNIRGFKMNSSDPDMGNWSYTYYPTGELYTQTDAKNQTVTLTYDAISRLRTRVELEGTTTFNYGTSAALRNIGKLESVTSPGGYGESYLYDTLGRPQYITYTEDQTYTVDYSYNNQGSLDTVTYPTSTSGYRLKLQYAYAYGQLAQVRDYSAGTQFWTLQSTNTANQPIDERLANGVRLLSGFDSVNGSLLARQSGNSGSTSNLENLAYQWDKAGNLKQRQDLTQGLTEIFNYDALNRLDNSTRNGAQNMDVTVNAVGNLTYKKVDANTINFDYSTQQSGCSYYAYSQPHAVRQAGGNAYCYDANGNMTKRAGSTIEWTSYNLPSQINSGSNYSQFSYGASRNRWKQVANYAGTAETTIYVGGLLEKVTRSGVTEYKHYISGGSSTAIYTRRSNGTNSTYYVSSDHLGSANVITDGTGAAVVRESFDAYGARRGTNWTGAPSAADQSQFTATTRHGYTGHEMLDNLNLIHMNGRVYDPSLGRFISADPFIQSPMNQQSLNRYSYVMNGPMSATDPSGYLSLRNFVDPFDSVGRWATGAALSGGDPVSLLTLAGSRYLNDQTDKFFAKNPDLQPIATTIATIVVSYYATPISGAYMAGILNAHFTRLNGGSDSDILKSFVVSFATTYAFSAVGSISNPVLSVGASAAIGCASAAANGGNCRQGALSAGVSAGYYTLGFVDGFYGAAIAGGLGSEAGGGDFWEGAKMAGMSYIVAQSVRGNFSMAQLGRETRQLAQALATDIGGVMLSPVGIAWGFATDIKGIWQSIGSGSYGAALKGLLMVPYNIALPHYGLYGGAGWGTNQFGTGLGTAPLNAQDWANYRHDVTCGLGSCDNLGWVKDSWNTNSGHLPSGPFGIAYKVLGTVPFSVAGAFD